MTRLALALGLLLPMFAILPLAASYQSYVHGYAYANGQPLTGVRVCLAGQCSVVTDPSKGPWGVSVNLQEGFRYYFVDTPPTGYRRTSFEGPGLWVEHGTDDNGCWFIAPAQTDILGVFMFRYELEGTPTRTPSATRIKTPTLTPQVTVTLSKTPTQTQGPPHPVTLKFWVRREDGAGVKNARIKVGLHDQVPFITLWTDRDGHAYWHMPWTGEWLDVTVRRVDDEELARFVRPMWLEHIVRPIEPGGNDWDVSFSVPWGYTEVQLEWWALAQATVTATCTSLPTLTTTPTIRPTATSMPVPTSTLLIVRFGIRDGVIEWSETEGG